MDGNSAGRNQKKLRQVSRLLQVGSLDHTVDRGNPGPVGNYG